MARHTFLHTLVNEPRKLQISLVMMFKDNQVQRCLPLLGCKFTLVDVWLLVFYVTLKYRTIAASFSISPFKAPMMIIAPVCIFKVFLSISRLIIYVLRVWHTEINTDGMYLLFVQKIFDIYNKYEFVSVKLQRPQAENIRQKFFY